ncbi:PpiC-type peptidyl-prolyl cis-trans isomerase [Roseobacter sp. SK209-2-6]|uniref:peptidylprolyl isomerase n=1 Tax=Roseobacter sp. SK209-2-6 TaxID=388739 RepID=UPI0000F3EEDC|nr:peptidylprolyl isomerase [Roseobacter sp. SK209-2-6]EBA15579.1 PpiC-type peptidyl-prolyl cis-trans isomerase [Roseobacter sp. SK209-2-6]
MNSALFPELVVNGETVPHTEIAAETQNQEAPAGKPGIAWRKAANAVAIRTLLLQEARRQKIEADPHEVEPGRFETDEEALIRGLLETEVDVKSPTDDEIKAEWARDPARFRSAPLWEVSHILCACDPRDEEGREKALKKAQFLTATLLAKPSIFASLAKKESDCGSKEAGGSLGQLRPGDSVPEFEQVLFDLEQGQITAEPVLSRHGYHIVRMDALAEGQELPFEAAKRSIMLAMEKAAWTRAAQAYVQKLIEGAEISGADFKPI